MPEQPGSPPAQPFEMPFPVRGVDRSQPLTRQPPDTCDDALNIETFDQRERRGGGKRMGTVTAFDEELVGPVNHMQIYRLSAALAAIDPGENPGPGPAPEVWAGLGSGVNGEVNALGAFPVATTLIAGGDFTTAGGSGANRIAAWDGTAWSALGNGLASGSGAAAAIGDNAKRLPRYRVAGTMMLFVPTDALDNLGEDVSAWDGTTWSAPGSFGGDSAFKPVSLVIFDDGNGAKLYDGGNFTNAGGVAAADDIAVYDFDTDTWDEFGADDFNFEVFVLAVFNDGTGNKLYAGGNFTTNDATALPRFAVWNGTAWVTVAGGVGNNEVFELVPFDGKLILMGTFSGLAGESLTASTSLMAQYDPIVGAIQPMAHGLRGSPNTTDPAGAVFAGFVYDDGGGDVLYVVGNIHAGSSPDNNAGVACAGIARWDGTTWTAPPRGFLTGVSATAQPKAIRAVGSQLASKLFVGGEFTVSNIVPMNNLGAWDGENWVALGGAAWRKAGTSGSVDDAAVRVAIEAQLGSATETSLYCGGSDTTTGGDDKHWGIGPNRITNPIAAFDGENWVALGSGVSGGDAIPEAMIVWDDGTGDALFVAGSFTSPGSRIAKWSGTAWSALGSGLEDDGLCLAVYDDGGGEALYAGGEFTTPGRRIAGWDGSAWFALSDSGDDGFADGEVLAMVVFGGELWVGGSFTGNGTKNLRRICSWDGTNFTEREGFSDGEVRGLAVFNGDLYAVGSFTQTVGSTAVSRVARWNGTSWQPLGAGVDGNARAVFVHDDGANGERLYVGGIFATAGGVSAVGVAAWNGTTWAKVDDASGTGILTHSGASAFVRGFATFRGDLVMAGTFLGASGGGPAWIARGDAAP